MVHLAMMVRSTVPPTVGPKVGPMVAQQPARPDGLPEGWPDGCPKVGLMANQTIKQLLELPPNMFFLGRRLY